MNTTRNARAEASAWITRLHGPNRSPEMEAGFRQWLAESPHNAEEFEALTELWDMAVGLPAGAVTRMSRRMPEGPRPTKNFAVAFAAMLVLAVGVVAFTYLWMRPAPIYLTGVGEQRTMVLEDGSKAILNSGSRISLAFDQNERRVLLEQGEVLFEVAHDTSRPFFVVAGTHEVRAVGTQFVVRHAPERTMVTLLEGKVIVQSSKESSVTLAVGDRVTFAPTAPPQLDQPRLEIVTAWRRGEVLLDETSLADAVAEMNRYDRRTIVIDDERIGALSMNGLYHAGDNADFARSVAHLYGLKLVERDGRLHLQSR